MRFNSIELTASLSLTNDDCLMAAKTTTFWMSNELVRLFMSPPAAGCISIDSCGCGWDKIAELGIWFERRRQERTEMLRRAE